MLQAEAQITLCLWRQHTDSPVPWSPNPPVCAGRIILTRGIAVRSSAWGALGRVHCPPAFAFGQGQVRRSRASPGQFIQL